MKVTYKIYREKFEITTNRPINPYLLAEAADYILAYDLYDYAMFVDRGFKRVCLMEDITIISVK